MHSIFLVKSGVTEVVSEQCLTVGRSLSKNWSKLRNYVLESHVIFKIVYITHKNLIYSYSLLKSVILLYSKLSLVLICQMARTFRTARKRTGGRYPVGQLAPRYQPEVEDEEDPEEVQLEDEVEVEEDPEEQPQLYDGTYLEVDAEGDMVIPPAPDAADDAPPPPPDAPVHDAPTPDAAGGDPDDDDDNDDDDDDDDDGDDEDDEPEEEPQNHGAEYHIHSTVDEKGQFCVLLEEVLQQLDFTEKPMYFTKHYSQPGMRDYYETQVHIRVPLGDDGGWRTRSSHYSTAPFSTEEAAVNDAARRALWSLSHSYREQLYNSDFRHVPHRLSGTEETVVPAVRFGEGRLDILTRITAALNTDLEGATAELDRTHEELRTAQARIAQLEAQLAGQQLPEEVAPNCLTASPPRKRLRYGTPEATTRVG